MTGPLLYELSVPVIRKAVNNQLLMLAKAEQWCKDNGHPESKIIEARLQPDMLPFTFQIQTIANTTAKLLDRLSVVKVPSVPDNEKTFAELIARLQGTLQFLDQAKPEAFAGKEENVVEFTSAAGDLKFVAPEYIQTFALPNLFFHHTIAYAIYRTQGIDVGKQIYLSGIDKQIVFPPK